MVKFQIWKNCSDLWFAQMLDPITVVPEHKVIIARSRGEVIALVKYRTPLSHIEFLDRYCATDP